jgi:hypothetical protein
MTFQNVSEGLIFVKRSSTIYFCSYHYNRPHCGVNLLSARVTFRDILKFHLTVQKVQEYQVREVLKCIIHTIIFNRALGHVSPRDVDLQLLDLSYVEVCDEGIERQVEAGLRTVQDFLKTQQPRHARNQNKVILRSFSASIHSSTRLNLCEDRSTFAYATSCAHYAWICSENTKALVAKPWFSHGRDQFPESAKAEDS